MTNEEHRKGNAVGLAVMLLLTIALISSIVLSSCGTIRLTDEQVSHRNEVQYEINKVWNEYTYKTDSLWIEYHKK